MILENDNLVARLNSDKVVLLDLFTKWAGNCVPIEQFVAKQDMGIDYLKIEIDEMPNMESIQNDCAPHLCLFKNGIMFYYTNEPDSTGIEHALNGDKTKMCHNAPFVINREEKNEGKGKTKALFVKPDSLGLESKINEQFINDGTQVKQTKKCDTDLIADTLISTEFLGLERVLLGIKPESSEYSDQIIEVVKSRGFKVIAKKQIQLNENQLKVLYGKLESLEFYSSFMQWMLSESLIFYVLEKENGIKDLKMLLGPKDKDTAKKLHPESLRSLFSSYKEYWQNCAHSSDRENVLLEITSLFPELEFDPSNSYLKENNSILQNGNK